jgi:hydroxymethylglutaryl-CoA lyase
MEEVRICEVGPRDGLQSEAPQSIAVRSELVTRLIDAGLLSIEIGSFLNPKAVPSMAHTDALVDAIATKRDACQFTALVFNERGLEQAITSGVAGVCIVAIVSEGLALSNTKQGAEHSIANAAKLANLARAAGLFVRIDVAPAWICPFEGRIGEKKLLTASDTLWQENPDEFVLADTIGRTNPQFVKERFQTLCRLYDVAKLGAHFHDTNALGLANVVAALDCGVRLFDSSVGGLGGCPFAPGASGNLATEDLVFLLNQMGFATGVNALELGHCVDWLGSVLGRRIGGRTIDCTQDLSNIENSCSQYGAGI